MAENNLEAPWVKLVMDINNLFQTTVFIASKGLAISIYLTTGSFFIGLGFGFVIAFFQTVVGGVVSKILDIVVRILRSAPNTNPLYDILRS